MGKQKVKTAHQRHQHRHAQKTAQTAAAIAEQHCGEVYDCHTIERALELALEKAAPRDCVLVCGSLYLIGEAEKILRTRQKAAE